MTPDELVAARSRLALRQADLARELGHPRGTVWRWEKGRRRIPPTVPLALEALEARRLREPANDLRKRANGRPPK
jgi:DNA-binding transcriptional regulator YiaG